MRLKSPAPTDDTTVSPVEKPTSYRTVGSLGTGAVLVAFGALFLFAFGLGSEKHPVGSMVGLVMLVSGVVGGIYPAAFSHADHLTVRNPFRRIDISWPRVESVSAKLSLVVETVAEEGKAHKYTIWSVPVSMHERRKSDRAVAKQARAARAESARQAAGAGDIAGSAMGAAGYGRPKSLHEDPLEHMALADQAVVEMRDRQRVCTTSVENAAPTAVTWTWYTLAPFVVSVALLVAAIAGAF
ncbi:hypothetical protein ABH935_000951 [Catenulispora sp. GAS73]|uniref:PH domain-containing protein n=1 Tax=Catenulispora sp. GAS73 TaxID=3156269 RepID=UPI0035176B66